MSAAQIDYYSSAKATTASRSMTLPDLVAAMAGEDYKATVTRLRDKLALGDKPGYDAEKRDLLPAVSVSGICDGKRLKAFEEGRFKHSGLLQIDFDAGDNVGWTVPEMLEQLREDPRVIAAFVSPSGVGAKGIARIPVCTSKAEHVAAFVAVRDAFAARNLKMDEACKDPVRLMFVSHDPQAWIDTSRSEVFTPSILSLPAAPAAKPKGLVLRAKTTEFPAPPVEGIHTWLMDAAWHCRFHGMDESATIAKLGSFDGSLRRPLQPTEAVDAARQVFAATMHESTADWKAAESVAAMTTRPPGSSSMKAFDPEDVFYDGPSSKYLVRVGNAFFTYSKLSPIVTGVTRHLADQYGDPKELIRAVKAAVADRELDGGIQWHGGIAGHAQGLALDSNGLPILITSEAKIPGSAPGDFPIIVGLMEQAFQNPIAFEVFLSWLAGRMKAVRSHTHIPSPMLVLAGEVNSGKSLLAWIVSQLLGGRIANPYSSWSGEMLWNDDLIGSELLLVDDCSASTDIRARRAFGAAFKEAMYPASVQLRKRHSSSISVRPVWAVMVCCNDTPEALQIIPPLDNDMSDKVILLHVSHVVVPMDTTTGEGKLAFQAVLRQELPAFADFLDSWETPAELHDSRSGVKAWRDPDLVDSVATNSPARRLEQLIETATSHLGIWHDLPCTLTAMDIESRLMDNGSPVRDQARQMFTWYGACSSALARLVSLDSHVVTCGGNDKLRKTPLYKVQLPIALRP